VHLEFKDEKHLQSVIEGVYKCLIESCLPVKAEAALTLTKFIIESDKTK
jgi:hypothetical protein